MRSRYCVCPNCRAHWPAPPSNESALLEQNERLRAALNASEQENQLLREELSQTAKETE